MWAQGGSVVVNTKTHQKRTHGVKQPQSPKPQRGLLTMQTASPLLELIFYVRNVALLCSLRTLIGLISGGLRFQSCLRWRFKPSVTTMSASHCDSITVFSAVAVWGQRMGLSPLCSAVQNNKAHPDHSLLQLWL